MENLLTPAPPKQRFPRMPIRRAACIAALALVSGLAGGSRAAPVAHIESADGLTLALAPHQEPRYVVPGDALNEGDTIIISRRGFANLSFIDGTRMTLRPGTRLAIDKYAHGGGQEIARLRLLKGGVRAATGLIAARNPEDGYRIDTALGEIRVRGTDFDARLCAADCAADAKPGASASGPVASPVVARVALLRGNLTATGQGGATRKLVRGGPVYVRDTLETAPAAYAVLAFRDDSRLTLQGGTNFAVENYRYDPAKPQDNSVVLRLLKGSVRATTGLIGKTTPEAYRMATPTVATVRVTGTGFDLTCDERCAHPVPDGSSADGLYLLAWDGTVQLALPSEVVSVKRDHSAFLGSRATRAVVLGDTPERMRDNPTPRPDGVPVDIRTLFGVVAADASQPGLYVLVRNGHVTLSHEASVIELGRDESGRVDPAGNATRLDAPPSALLADPSPRTTGSAGTAKPAVEVIEERPATDPQDQSHGGAVCLP
jgi:hypothetical protein